MLATSSFCQKNTLDMRRLFDGRVSVSNRFPQIADAERDFAEEFQELGAVLFAHNEIYSLAWAYYADAVYSSGRDMTTGIKQRGRRIRAWVRTWLPGSRWLGKQYHYRLDRDGYAWLNLDWVDGANVQRPGAPFKPLDTATIYYPHELRWDTEGELLDSLGQPKLKEAPVESIKMGVR